MTEEEFEKGKIIENASKIEVLLNSDGWALIVEKMKARLKSHWFALKRCTPEELSGLQARVDEIEIIERLPRDFLKARKKIKENENG